MFRKNNILLFTILSITLLFGWGADINIAKTRAADDKYPVGYDIVWVNDTLMFAGIAYNTSGNNYIEFYKSTDGGQTWGFWKYASTTYELKSIDMEYSGDTLYSTMLHKNGYLALCKIPFDGNVSYISINTTDSTVSAFLEIITRSGQKIFYIGTQETDLSAGYDTFVVYKSVDYGNSWTSVQYGTPISPNTQRITTDFDCSFKSDTLLLFLTYQFTTSDGDISAYARIFKDNPDGSLNYDRIQYISVSTTIKEAFPCLSSYNQYVISLYEEQDSAKIYYSYSIDYGNTFDGPFEFPFNEPDSSLFSPCVDFWWSSIPYPQSGFEIIYIKNQKLYYVSLTNGNTPSWGTPELISNETSTEYFLFYLFNYNYRPKIMTMKEFSGAWKKAVIWNHDYWHGTFPNLTYDSTYFYTDNSVVNIQEIVRGKRANLHLLNTIVKRDINFILPSDPGKYTNLFIYDILGRKRYTINLNRGTNRINISALKTGIYILKAETKGKVKEYKIIKFK